MAEDALRQPLLFCVFLLLLLLELVAILVAAAFETSLRWCWVVRQVGACLVAFDLLLRLVFLFDRDLSADVASFKSILNREGCRGPVDHLFPALNSID